MSVSKTFCKIERQIEDLLQNFEDHLMEDIDKWQLHLGRITTVYYKPFVIQTARGERKLEPKAYELAVYCCGKYENLEQETFSFAEIGELFYEDEMTPRSTIQNLVKRCKSLSEIGINLSCRGETIRIYLTEDL